MQLRWRKTCTSLLVSTHRLTISGVIQSAGVAFFASADWAQAGPSPTIPIFGPKRVSCLFSDGDSVETASTGPMVGGGSSIPVAMAVALREVLVSVLAR